ncbi:Aminodeoxychorismate synthase [Yarrowia sp. B02]|nr:Aminodeoxychorismate synthase [Yarrowia sp. B02]
MNILLIDSYDSFTFNLTTLIEQAVPGASVVTIHNDSVSASVLVDTYLSVFDAVVVGPGPGCPQNPADVGCVPQIWSNSKNVVVPTLGVCLGFQSLCLGEGLSVDRLKLVKHGQVAQIAHNGDALFADVPEVFDSVRYHSLHVPWAESAILPLAWTSDIVDGNTVDVLMAGKHAHRPFWGVQYHPESICSHFGDKLVHNFCVLAREYNKTREFPENREKLLQEFTAKFSIKPAPLTKSAQLSIAKPLEETSAQKGEVLFDKISLDRARFSHDAYPETMVCLGEHLHRQQQHFVMLNSAAIPGRWSILGLLDEGKTRCITHYTDYKASHAFMKTWGNDPHEHTPRSEYLVKLGDDGIWGYLSAYMKPKIEKFRACRDAIADCPFYGGLVGYFSYETNETRGIDALVNPTPADRPFPDVNLVDVERSVLFDHQECCLYVVSVTDDDHEWVRKTSAELQTFFFAPDFEAQKDALFASIPSTSAALSGEPKVSIPDQDDYIQRVEKCQEYLRAGESYELCLTAQTKIKVPQKLRPWDLYKILYTRNPAPYSCFLDLQDATLVGSSPERFLSWSKDGVCEFRPIKGTIKNTPEMTRAIAEEKLNTPKERAENLMIVDLIRHDLNQMLRNVRVDKLMTVEEYKTVFQLVSVIQGDLHGQYSGIDALAHSLPPGSMTGAPKLRSVELLRELENNHRRGIYSGVCGFWSVSDQGDWSVVIRSAFSYKDESEAWEHTDDPASMESSAHESTGECQIWRIGAGGAITVLSDPMEEWLEMKTKLESALQAFV